MKKVSAKLCAPPVQFLRRNSLVVLTEVHLRPCVYAGLTLKCHHKLVPLAMKSWKNLSVHTSPVYIIIVLAKTTRIKRKSRTSFLLACCDIANKSFSCYSNKKKDKKSQIWFNYFKFFTASRRNLKWYIIKSIIHCLFNFIVIIHYHICFILKRDNLYTRWHLHQLF